MQCQQLKDNLNEAPKAYLLLSFARGKHSLLRY